MSDKDKLIDAQGQIIGILFELVKRQQANSELDREYLQMLSGNKRDEARIEEITSKRLENAKIIARLLEQLQT